VFHYERLTLPVLVKWVTVSMVSAIHFKKGYC
jgi:hypothetical protein